MLPMIFAGVVALAAATGTYSLTRSHYERVIAEQRAAQSALLAEAHANALRETKRLQEAADKAAKAAAKRQSALARDLAANRSALGMLSGAADGALRSAHDSHGACVATATAQGDVLKQCSTRLVEVAAAADGHASDAMTLRDAWPR